MVALIGRQSRELELMFRCSRLQLHANDRTRIGELTSGPIDWSLFLQTVERNHVAPLVNRTFQTLMPPGLPQKVSETVRVRTKITTWKNQRFVDQLSELDAALQNAGHSVLHYKGAAAAARLYGDIRLRTFNDCDFLVHRSDLREALKCIEDCGFQRDVEIDAAEQDHSEREFKEYLFIRDDFRVEPHWSLSARRYPFDIDYAGLWARATRLSLDGHSLAVMSPEDDCLVLCIAGAKGFWKRYQMVTDIAGCTLAFPDLDWDGLLLSARSAGAERIVLLGLLLAAELAGGRVPERILALARSCRTTRRLAEGATGAFEGRLRAPKWLPSSPHLVRRDLLLMRERPVDRWKYLWRATTTPTLVHRRLFRLPEPLSWLYVPLTPAYDYVAFPAFKALKHLAPGVAALCRSRLSRRSTTT